MHVRIISSSFHDVVFLCWDEDPEGRPSFSDILSTLERLYKRLGDVDDDYETDSVATLKPTTDCYGGTDLYSQVIYSRTSLIRSPMGLS